MSAPKLPSFFKVAKNRQFEYKPTYYDQSKEELKERISRIKKDVEREKSAGIYSTGLKERMHQKWSRADQRKTHKRSNLVIFALAGALAILAYYYFYR